jgi:tetratricopeptide (TPR) repeat protein
MPLAIFLVVSTLLSRSEAADLQQTAELSFINGDLCKALCMYERLSHNHPENWIFKYNAGLLSVLTGDTLTGLTLLNEVSLHRPKNPQPYYQIALLMLAENDTTAALHQLETALDYDRQYLPSLIKYTELLALKGCLEEATRWSDYTAKEFPLSAPARKMQAYCLSLAGMTDEAIRVIERGIENFPHDGLLELGISLSESRNDRDRLDEYRLLYSMTYPSLNNDGIVNNSRCEARLCEDFSRFDSAQASEWLETGVRYTYKGYWGPFKLGTLEVEVCTPMDTVGVKCIPINYRIRSNPALWFISVDDVYRAYLIPEQRRILRYDMHVRETWWKFDRRSDMDVLRGMFINRMIDEERLISVYEGKLPANLFDGISILFFARMMVHGQQSGRAPTLIGNDIDWTGFHFTGEKDKIEVAGRYWDACKAIGVMDYVGVAGMTGQVDGWFSTDGQALPLSGSFKIFIGSIILVLDNVEKL